MTRLRSWQKFQTEALPGVASRHKPRADSSASASLGVGMTIQFSSIASEQVPSYCGHLGRPGLYQCCEAVERLGEIVSRGGKTQAKMRGRIEAIAGSQQDSTLGGGLAKRAGIFQAQQLSIDQPGKCGHAASRRNPAQHVAMLRHEGVEELEVSGSDFLGLAKHDVTFADCDFRKNLSSGGVRDREVSARGP